MINNMYTVNELHNAAFEAMWGILKLFSSIRTPSSSFMVEGVNVKILPTLPFRPLPYQIGITSILITNANAGFK